MALTILTTYTPDTPDKLRADHAFVEGLAARLAKRELTDRTRVWMGREEIRNLRRIAGMNASNQWLDRLKNRRLRVATARQMIERATLALESRAVLLHTEVLNPKPKPWPKRLDPSVAKTWSQSLAAQVQAQSKLAHLMSIATDK